ncbi:MAG: ribosome-associated translation inhibitor RaiA [bacterium]|nr:ribosome-associated translation inhibitor RaiA [Patescibacteria group bacterium]MDW8280021.1 ribosome-associated translation inhibitor RaiA [bacterium]
MNIIIKATNIELTDSIKNYIEKKIRLLEKFLKKYELKSNLIFNVEIAKITKHHHKGDIFYTEINLKLPNKLLRVEEYDQDLYQSIDLTKDRLKEQILKFKEINQKNKKIKND